MAEACKTRVCSKQDQTALSHIYLTAVISYTDELLFTL